MRPLTLAVFGSVIAVAQAQALDCTGLTGTTIPRSAIGLPTSGAALESASFVNDPQIGAYCKLTGGIKAVDPAAPDIKFQINLPVRWNGKMLQNGGSGLNGTVITGERLRAGDPAKPQPIAQGYVTFGSDGGHKGAGNDASFALNAEAFTNFKGAQLKKTHDTALELVRRVFHKKPRQTYFLGGSEGGREALIAAERWPGDYDGIVSIFPAYDIVALGTSIVQAGQQIFGLGGASISQAKLSHASAKVLEVCDALDGLKDRIVGNVKACRAVFSIASLRCPNGTDAGTACLSDAQLGALRMLSGPRKLGVTLSGVDTVAGWPVVESDATPGTTIFGRSDDVVQSPAGNLGRSQTCFMVMQDANCDYMTFNPAAHADRLQQLSREMDVQGALAPFRKRGGKLLLVAGSSDMTIPPGNTVAYYEKLKSAHGVALPGFARFYMIAGMAHGGGGGNFEPGGDLLGALDTWVTKGKLPVAQFVTDTNKATAGRTRPLCEFPAYPKYNGLGDINQAASFTCAMP
jgi:pimeloyl-ACP methyl ester carboxylesterase